MSELPRKAITRTAKLAALPLGFAGRQAWGLGKRVGGHSAEQVTAEIQARTAEQLLRVLGELKGGAMKFGQAMSIFEAAFPEEFAGPYRANLTKLQDSATTLPAASVHRVLADSFGRQWRRRFLDFDDVPAAAASIGQVHRATWKDGRDVAVKIQYPGAEEALTADLDQIARLGRLIGTLVPGLDTKPLLAEFKERMSEELDYALEAEHQAQFAAAYADDPNFRVPDVVAQAGQVLVSDWIEGTPLSRVIATGSQRARNTAGQRYVEFLFSGPTRAQMLHADPHPGNYRMLPDGRLGILDFGAVARLPEGLPPSIGRLLRLARDGDADTVLTGLRAEGFVKPSMRLDAQSLLDYLAPFTDPAGPERFTFSREWMRENFNRMRDPRQKDWSTGLKLNVPPEYLLIHRVWLGSVGVLCQLGAEVPVRALLETWIPGFADGPPERRV